MKYFGTIQSFMLCLLLVCCAGCAPKQSRIERVMPAMRDMNAVQRALGSPSTSRELADGATEHQWLLDSSYHEQGRWVREKSPWVRHDKDGYRVEVYRDVWYPPRDVTKYCRITIVADKTGKVVNRQWEGYSCDELVRSGALPGGSPW